MKFCLVSVERAKQEIKKVILEEAQKLFDSVLYAPMEKIRIECVEGKTKVMFKEIDLSKFDVVYVRIFGDDFVFGEILLDALNSLGVYTPNPAEAFPVCNHKYYTVKQVSRISVPAPKSSLSVSPEMSLHLANRIGFPAVVKLLSALVSIEADWSDPYIARSSVTCRSIDVAPSAAAAIHTVTREVSCPEYPTSQL